MTLPPPFPPDSHPIRCIIWNPDIFGFDSGITRQLADRLSSGLNATVVVPDYFRGDYRGPQEPGFRNYLRDMSDWDGQLKGDWEDKVRPYAEGHGCKVYGAHGEEHTIMQSGFNLVFGQNLTRRYQK